MNSPTSANAPIDHDGHAGTGLEGLARRIEHAAHLLPAQGPITVFIHHNTLHAFEDLPFTEALERGARVFSCHPYLTEDRYRGELIRGRIRFSELQDVLEADLGPDAGRKVVAFGTRLDLRLAMLQFPLRSGPTAELEWYVAESHAMSRVRPDASSAVRARLIAETRRWVMRDLRAGFDASRGGSSGNRPPTAALENLHDLLERFGEQRMEAWTESRWESFTLQALWRVCCDGARGLPHYTEPPPTPTRHAEILLEATGADADARVNQVLIPFVAAFLDQGLAHWELPWRDQGFLRSFAALYSQPGGPPKRWMRGLARDLRRILDEGISPLESIEESLTLLGVPEPEWDEFLSATLLALRGWAGMVRQIEIRGDRVVRPVPAGSLVEFLAARLILDRHAIEDAAREGLGFDCPASRARDEARCRLSIAWPPSVEQRAFALFQLAQVVGVGPDVLHRLDRGEWESLMAEIEAFHAFERRRVFHLAYERRFHSQALDAIGEHAPRPRPTPAHPSFQAIFCIDEREESIRRHLEEIAPDCVTFGTAGFFSVAMYYRGADEAHYVPLCPVIILPRHWVVESNQEDKGDRSRRRQLVRRALGRAGHRIHVGTRSFAAGAILSTAVGVLASIPLVARTLFPRLTSRVRGTVDRVVRAASNTRLILERSTEDPGPEGAAIGFSVAEMTDIAEKVLREIGLIDGFSRLILVMGHGSKSMNNPHESAYHCGACGGSRGGPNARAIAQILNDKRVRAGLVQRGLAVPESTYFLGGIHNTSSDSADFFDLDLLPTEHAEDFEKARQAFARACERDAHERCRRFLSAPLTLSFPVAKQRVEARGEDLAQVRPELGHATNAIVVVGRRSFTRGLFLDRRAFLVSYDPTQDTPETSILARILGAVFPVCSGINLEYFFSYVDNTGWGCGTKLPHNISALVGVMDGAASDLRTGLPWQMVEIHEPVRLLFVIETTPAAMFRLMRANEVIGRLCENGWVELTLIDPATRAVSVFERGEFVPYRPSALELPRAASSYDWYRGWRDHLEFAEIEP